MTNEEERHEVQTVLHFRRKMNMGQKYGRYCEHSGRFVHYVMKRLPSMHTKLDGSLRLCKAFI